MLRSYRLTVSCLILPMLGISGCVSHITAKKVTLPATDGGLVYCLLAPKIQVVTKEAVVYDQDVGNSKDLRLAARAIRAQTVSLVNIPSPDHYYSVKVDSGTFSSDSFTMNFDTNGCLTTLNFSSNDQTGTAISTLGSIILSGAALVAAAPSKELKYPAPSQARYELDRAAAVALKEAGERLASQLKDYSNLTADQKKAFADLQDRADKLRQALEPTPTQIVATEYIDLEWIADKDQDPDNFVLARYSTWTGPRPQVLVAVARRIN